MEWIVLSFFLTLGYIPSGGIQMYEPPASLGMSGSFYQKFEAEAEIFKMVRLGGSAEIQDWLLTYPSLLGAALWPNTLDALLYAEVFFGPVTVGYSHGCIHPIVPYQHFIGEVPLFDQWEDRIYVRVGGTIGK